MNALSDEQVTVDATAGGVSLTVPLDAKRCYIEIWTADIYYTLDGGTPASGNGGRAIVGDTINLMGDTGQERNSWLEVMKGLRMLRQGSTSGLAIVHYFD